MAFLDPEVNETVPSVGVDDLKAAWKLISELTAKAPKCKATGIDVFRMVCTPGADLEAVAWRMQHLEFAIMIGEEFAPFIHDGQPNEKLIQLFATFPFRVTERDGSSYK